VAYGADGVHCIRRPLGEQLGAEGGPGNLGLLRRRASRNSGTPGWRRCNESCVNYKQAYRFAPEQAKKIIPPTGGPLALPMFLRSIEDSGFSTWLRESDSPFAFYFVLLFHTFGLALLVGANGLVDLRLLGFFPVSYTHLTLPTICSV